LKESLQAIFVEIAEGDTKSLLEPTQRRKKRLGKLKEKREVTFALKGWKSARGRTLRRGDRLKGGRPKGERGGVPLNGGERV